MRFGLSTGALRLALLTFVPALMMCKEEEKKQSGASQSWCSGNGLFCMTNQERLNATIEVPIGNKKIRFFNNPSSLDVSNECDSMVVSRAGFGGGYASPAGGSGCKDLAESSFYNSPNGKWIVNTTDLSVALNGITSDGQVTIGENKYFCLHMTSAGVLKDGSIAGNALGDLLVLADKYVEKADQLSRVKVVHILAAEGACQSFYP